jgi:hypothetical protein
MCDASRPIVVFGFVSDQWTALTVEMSMADLHFLSRALRRVDHRGLGVGHWVERWTSRNPLIVVTTAMIDVLAADMYDRFGTSSLKLWSFFAAAAQNRAQ